jgi:hypothetical protein
MTSKIIDYDVWAVSPSTNQEKWPERPRSAITEQEAKEQADEFIAHLTSKTGITDWEGKWKAVIVNIDS